MKILNLILLISFFKVLNGQSSSLSGKVIDASNGSPLIGANVMIDGTSLGAATDKNGKYLIENLTEGEYDITVSYIGYKDYKKSFKINSNQQFVKDLELQPEAIEMETYVVTASRRRERVEDAPAAISVISKTEIRLSLIHI